MTFTELEIEDGLTLWDVSDMGIMNGQWWAVEGNDIGPLFIEQSLDPYTSESCSIQLGMVVMDCGANIGCFSKRALDLGAAQVISFEPSPKTYAALTRNMTAYAGRQYAAGRPYGSIMLRELACWHEGGQVVDVFINPVDSGWNSICIPTGATSTAKVTTICIDAVGETLERLDILKFDIEGAEINALRGAVETIKRFHPRVIIAAEHRPTDDVEIPAALQAIEPRYRIVHRAHTTLFMEYR